MKKFNKFKSSFGEFDHKKFISEIKMFDSEVVDLTPTPSSRIEKM